MSFLSNLLLTAVKAGVSAAVSQKHNTSSSSNKNVDMAGYYYDTWDFGDVSCPECGETMGYNALKAEFKCPECGNVYDDNDIDFDEYDSDGIPVGCAACGGPYPDCMSSCKIFDD